MLLTQTIAQVISTHNTDKFCEAICAFANAVELLLQSLNIASVHNDRTDSVNKDVTELENDTVNDTEKRQNNIIELIKLNKYISFNALALKLSISRSTVVRNIDALKEKGIIKRIGPDKGGYWEVMEKTKDKEKEKGERRK